MMVFLRIEISAPKTYIHVALFRNKRVNMHICIKCHVGEKEL